MDTRHNDSVSSSGDASSSLNKNSMTEKTSLAVSNKRVLSSQQQSVINRLAVPKKRENASAAVDSTISHAERATTPTTVGGGGADESVNQLAKKVRQSRQILLLFLFYNS